jgi:O-acetyl-ADP-ribose deacetylase (regulator of RNase III)
LAVEIATRETIQELNGSDAIDKVIFACFDESVYASYRRAIQKILQADMGLR